MTEELTNQITHPFAEDSIHSVYKELKDLEVELLNAADECRHKGMDAARAKGVYEALKHTELLALFVEEDASQFVDEKGKICFRVKRTIDQREAIYRDKFAAERLAWTLADREYEVSKDYVTALQSALKSVQTRADMIRSGY